MLNGPTTRILLSVGRQVIDFKKLVLPHDRKKCSDWADPEKVKSPYIRHFVEIKFFVDINVEINEDNIFLFYQYFLTSVQDPCNPSLIHTIHSVHLLYTPICTAGVSIWEIIDTPVCTAVPLLISHVKHSRS